MSTFFGLFHRNLDIASNVEADRVLQSLCYWDPDRRGCITRGAVALGHAMLWNTPSSEHEILPAAKDAVLLTSDTRLDDRETLAAKLGLPAAHLEGITDSELLLSAYAAWGTDMAEHLVGDFAFVIWDEKTQTMLCVRDQIGIKSLYYYLDDALFFCANDLHAFTAMPQIALKIDEHALTNYFMNASLTLSESTLYHGVKKLPPAHVMTVSEGAHQSERYWKPVRKCTETLPDAVAYARQLRTLLEQAVSDRLRTRYPAASHLSGGLDSSGVAAIASQILRSRGLTLKAYNWVPEPRAGDDVRDREWSNSALVADHGSIDHRYMTLDGEAIYTYISHHDVAEGDSAGFWYEYAITAKARANNVRTMLTGWGGDEMTTYHGNAYYANLLRSGKFYRLLREIYARAKKRRGLRHLLAMLYFELLLPYVNRGLYCAMPWTRCNKPEYSAYFTDHWKQLLTQSAGQQPLITMQPYTTIFKHMQAYLDNGHLQGRIESWGAIGRMNRMEYVFPLLDKRVVEFMMNIPEEHFVQHGVGRYLFRLAVADSLPEKIVWDKKQTEINRTRHLWKISLNAYRKICQDLIREKHVSHYADLDTLSRELEAMDEETIPTSRAREFSKIISILLCEKKYRSDKIQ